MSESRALRLTLSIETIGYRYCATEYEGRCPFYDDYECTLFGGGLLNTEGSGENFRVLRDAACLAAEVKLGP